MKHYDYIILGTGPAGYKLAKLIAKTGKSLLAVEGGLFGGTCPNVGCEPKIFLHGTIAAALATQQLVGKGIVEPAKIDWSQLMKAKKARFDSWPDETREIYENMCDVEVGYGKFVGPHTIEVNGKQYQGNKIIIATGHRPHRLTFPGHELTHDSSDVLSLSELPKRTVVIGAGFVGIELATFLAAAGSEVTILVHSDRILRGFYQKYAQELITKMEQRGIKIIFFTETQKLEQIDNELILTTNRDEEIPTDYVIDASGRIPNADKLNLESAGIEYDRKGITVDDHLMTTAADVYAIGDITNQKLPKLTTVAEYEAGYLFDYLEKGKSEAFVAPVIGTTAFAYPELAQVGHIPEKDDSNYEIVEHDLSGGSLYAGMNEQTKLTLVFNHDHQLVGASEIGAQAADDINYLIPVIGLKITGDEWREKLVPIYPALADKIGGLL